MDMDKFVLPCQRHSLHRLRAWRTPAAAQSQGSQLLPRVDMARVSQADKAGSPFEALNIKEINEGAGRTRVRQHVNPLRSEYRTQPPPPDWAALFSDPTRPLVVDMGCGPGRFLLLLQRIWAEHGRLPHNFLGLEIRAPLVERANRWALQLGVAGEVAYMYTNATLALPAGLLGTYPGPISHFLVQFPDPHFKKRHHKRRIIQPPVVAAAAQLLPPGALVLLQSDVHDAAVAMRDAFEAAGGGAFRLADAHADPTAVFATPPLRPASDAGTDGDEASAAGPGSGAAPPAQPDSPDTARARSGDAAGSAAAGGAAEAFVSSWQHGGWLCDNPLGVATERELYVSEGGAPVYRVLLERTGQQATAGGSAQDVRP